MKGTQQHWRVFSASQLVMVRTVDHATKENKLILTKEKKENQHLVNLYLILMTSTGRCHHSHLTGRGGFREVTGFVQISRTGIACDHKRVLSTSVQNACDYQ